MMKLVYEWASGTDQVVYIDLEAIVAIQPGTQSYEVLVTLQKANSSHQLIIESPFTKKRKELIAFLEMFDAGKRVNPQEIELLKKQLFEDINNPLYEADMKALRDEHMLLLIDAWKNSKPIL